MTQNRIDIPAFTYPIPVVGAKPQCVSSADRPWCSLINCLANLGNLKGVGLRLDHTQQAMACHRALGTYDIPPERSQQWADALAGEKLGAPRTAEVGGMTLDIYQMNAIARMTSAGGVMALSCGLGKTPAAIAAAFHMTQGEADPRLWIVCPINAFPTWRRWLPYLTGRFGEVRIISMDSLHKAHPSAAEGGVIIFDEVHLLGVTKAKRTQEAHRIRRAFDYGLCLTGTLLHGGIEKTLSILDLAVPGLARFANRWNAGEYFNCLVKKDLGGRKVTSLVRPVGPNREAFFRWLDFGCVSYNRHSDEVKAAVNIPDQTLHRIIIGEPWEPLHDVAAQVALWMLEKDGELPDAAKVAHHLCRTGVETKLAWLLDMMQDNDEPVVVCAEYTDSLDALETGLNEAGVSYGRVDGSVTGADRMEIQRKFQAGEIRVFLGQMDAATVSLDLDRSCISVGIDHTWKAANYDQFLGRTARRTQKRECHHFDLVANALQDKVVTRIREQMDFDASLVEWADLKRSLDMLKTAV
jgi:hypothetical protein